MRDEYGAGYMGLRRLSGLPQPNISTEYDQDENNVEHCLNDDAEVGEHFERDKGVEKPGPNSDANQYDLEAEIAAAEEDENPKRGERNDWNEYHVL